MKGVVDLKLLFFVKLFISFFIIILIYNIYYNNFIF